jgi:DNA-binding transcriptional LysR family regulator
VDFRYLKAFMATVEQGSFSKAAEDLNIAQSAVSRQVKLLEESVGDELLIRSPKQLALTPKGQKLYAALQNFQSEAKNLLTDGERSVIRIGIPHGLLETWFQGVLGQYFKTCDDNLIITVGGLQELREGLEKGRFELIFTPFEIDSELISSRSVLEESFAIVSVRDLRLDALDDHRWIVYGPEDQLFRSQKRLPKRLIQVNSITAMLKLVKQGVGIALLPDHMIQKEKDLYIYRTEGFPSQTIYASHLRYRRTPEALERLLQHI